MKICPNCRRTYPNDDLNFCLEDGALLTVAGSEPAETVEMKQAPFTAQAHGADTAAPKTSWDNGPTYSLQPKRSRAWIWVLGVLGIGLLLCGGGVVGFIALVALNEQNPEFVESTDRSADRTEPATERNVTRIDLSEWLQPQSNDVTTTFESGEFLMRSNGSNTYYVLVAPQALSMEGAKVRVTVKNAGNADSRFGYGLVFMSDPKPLTDGYAFLIDSKSRRFRVVHHALRQENAVVKWERSPAIRSGTAENVLEARDLGGTVELSINGQVVTSIERKRGRKDGVPGIYSGGGVRIGFKDFSIQR